MRNTQPHVAVSAHLLAARGAAGYRTAGIHTYIANLLEQLTRLDSGLRFTVYTNAQPPIEARLRPARWSTARPAGRIAWEQFVQPLALRRDRADLLHATAFVTPLLSSCPAVVTVYDLSFAVFPDLFRGPNQVYLRWFTRRSVKRARRVIAISEHTRRDVHRLYGVPLDRIDVAEPGVDARFQPLPRDEVEVFRRERHLPDRFFLYLGTLEPRKNLARLIEAFAQLTTDHCSLILAGGTGWLVEELFAKVKSLGLESRITFTGYVPGDELPLWYNAATAFVYPSRYEGFGIPPLEAMACGTPVVTSNAASLPEVMGDAGLTVDPDDVPGLARAMRRVWDDAALRADLSRRGVERARGFTWEATARATLESYRRALGNGVSQNPLSSLRESHIASDDMPEHRN
jgi:glycosyltransferase involved in cell wall biosynthesis